jgi:hypothetical protein
MVRKMVWLLLGVAVLITGFAPTVLVEPNPPDEGEILAKIRCSNCHAYPKPELLPRFIWEENILPRMGWQLGIYADAGTRDRIIEKGVGGKYVRDAGVFPEKQQITNEDWEKIKAFYLKNAPDSLAVPEWNPIHEGLPHFKTSIPSELRLSPPSATLVRFRNEGGLFLGDANSKRLYWMDKKLNTEKAANLAEGVVDIQHDDNGSYVTMMGSFSPTDAPVGYVIYIPNENPRAEVLLEGLQRPVNSKWADLNGDGLTDGVVCEFAKWTGGLTLHIRQADGSFKRTLLRNRPGAIRSYIRDFNKDGHPDIIALFGQGDEGIYRYINDGKGNFTEERVMRFPPTYGSSSFRLVDVNGDGHEDIVYACGDNADYKPILKPYHGIRFFTNDGENNYQESFFYHLNGAYDAIPADFDQDGDLDIAVVSFFPDFPNRPQEGFVYLDNDGNGNYKAYTFPEVESGRWIVMDAGDLEGDGDIDLVLGPLTFEVVPDGGEVDRWVKGGIPFVVLENVD